MTVRVVLIVLLLSSVGCGSNPSGPSCAYTVTPLLFSPCMSRAQSNATVVTASGCSWTAGAGASWIAIEGPAAGIGPGTFAFTVAENYAAPRESVVQVRWPGAADGQTIRIAQGGCLYSLNPVSTAVLAVGVDGSFDVYPMAEPNGCGGPQQDRCTWTAQADVPWVTIIRGTGSDIGRVDFRVSANDSSLSRTGTITVRDKQFQITQSGR